VNVKTALGAHAADIYDQFAEHGHSGDDFSGIINFVRKQSKGR
jgi:3-hydroxyisobutyrate dehydrogenase